MSFWDWLIGERQTTLETVVPETAPKFEVSVPAEIFGIEIPNDPISPVSQISLKAARQVPAIKRARDLICGTLGGIPLQMVDSDNEIQTNSLLDQPENDVPRSVTWTRLYEDLLFFGIGWWRVEENDYRGYPTKIKRIDPEKVSVKDGKVWVNGRQVQNDQVIRFDSPNGPLLADGARAIKTLLRLESAAAKYSEDPMPQGYFAPTEGADPLEDEDIVALLTAWKTARQRGATGYVPAALAYKDVSFSPEQLQMSSARDHAVKEIARLTGISAEDLAVSTTSRTYFNAQQARQERINDVLAPFSSAVTDRLRMRDITPRGYSVRADFSGFLRADDQTRLQNYKVGLEIGLYDLEQIAGREGLPVPEEKAVTVARKEVVKTAEKITEESAV
jgi:Phage portal protein